jgi:hypothetical protein
LTYCWRTGKKLCAGELDFPVCMLVVVRRSSACAILRALAFAELAAVAARNNDAAAGHGVGLGAICACA